MNRPRLISSASLVAILLSGMALAASAQQSADMRKAIIERPIKRLISSDSQSLRMQPPQPSARMASFQNPKVKPGLVNWHPDFASACAASKQSSKPVLVFHMMGKLDDGFC